MEMRIAICLFGNLRTYDYCCESFRQCLSDLNDADVFIHTWNTLNHNTKTWHKNKAKNGNVEINNIKDEIISAYGPSSMLIENQCAVGSGEAIFMNRAISIDGIRFMIESICRSNEQRINYELKNNTKYDYILFTRPDILFRRNVVIKDILDQADQPENSIFFACNPKGHTLMLHEMGCQDLLFFAHHSVVEKFIKNKDEFLDSFVPGQIYPFGPEYYFIRFFYKLGFAEVPLNYLYGRDFEIVRLGDKRICNQCNVSFIDKIKCCIKKFVA